MVDIAIVGEGWSVNKVKSAKERDVDKINFKDHNNGVWSVIGHY